MFNRFKRRRLIRKKRKTTQSFYEQCEKMAKIVDMGMIDTDTCAVGLKKPEDIDIFEHCLMWMKNRFEIVWEDETGITFDFTQRPAIQPLKPEADVINLSQKRYKPKTSRGL